MNLIALAFVVFLLSSCGTPAPQIVISSDSGITVKGAKILTIFAEELLERDQAMAVLAKTHCSSLEKSTFLTLSDTSADYSITQAYECR